MFIRGAFTRLAYMIKSESVNICCVAEYSADAHSKRLDASAMSLGAKV